MEAYRYCLSPALAQTTWVKVIPGAIAEHDEKSLEAAIVCFFHLCQAADLGTVTMGRRGQPARLRLDPQALDGFLDGRAGEPDDAGEEAEVAEANDWQPTAPSLSAVAPAPANKHRTVSYWTAAVSRFAGLRS